MSGEMSGEMSGTSPDGLARVENILFVVVQGVVVGIDGSIKAIVEASPKDSSRNVLRVREQGKETKAEKKNQE